MNNGIFALARIKIAPYGNLVGNCRDIVDANEEKTAALCEGQSSDFFRVPTAFRQCAKIAVKTKTAVVTQLTKRFEASRQRGKNRRTWSWPAALFKGIRQSVGNRLFAQWHAA